MMIQGSTARYISHDPISNLRVKIRLKRITSTTVFGDVAETFANPNTGDPGGIEMVQKQEEAGAVEEVEVSWQEKLFSQREVIQYGELANCNTVRDRKYNKMIVAEREDGNWRSRRIFTVVEEDGVETAPSTKGALTYLEHKVLQARPAGRKQNYLPLQHPVQVPTNEAARRSNHVQMVSTQRMVIMADVGRARGLPRPEDEVALCTISLDSNRVLSVRPTFTACDGPRTVENSDGDVWEWTVEHVQGKVDGAEERREREVLDELFSRHASLLHSMVGASFTDPPDEGATRVHLFGEISRSWGFEGDNLFLSYSFDLPAGWCVEETATIRGTTQRSSVRETESGRISHYNHPFELTLYHSTMEEAELGSRPRLFVEVRSVDSWHRVRLEGYGYATLPSTPGCRTLTLDTWRPLGPDNATQLRRLFIGGTPELSDVRYTHLPSNYHTHPDQKTLLGKFGFRTVSSGSVELRLNTVHQTMPNYVEDEQRFKRVALKDKYGRPGVQLGLLDAIETFYKARKRLESVRTALQPSLSRLARNVATEQSIIKKWSKITFEN